MNIQTKARTLGLMAVLVLGFTFVQGANAGCGVVPGSKAASVTAPLGHSPGSMRFMPASYLQISDVSPDSHPLYAAQIVGLWDFKYIAEGNPGDMPKDGAVVDAGLTTWFADGNESSYSSMRAPETGAVCMGVWQQTGASTYDLNHIGLAWDPVHNVFLGPAFIKQYVTLDPAGNAYSGEFFLTQYAKDGKTVLAEVKGVIVATRITVHSD